MSTVNIEMDSIEITVICECGRDVYAEIFRGDISVTPCEYCLEKAREEARKEND